MEGVRAEEGSLVRRRGGKDGEVMAGKEVVKKCSDGKVCVSDRQ